jgi:hypothetical protein
MTGIDASSFKGYKAPLPAKGKVLVKIDKIETVEGKDPDDFGEISSGFHPSYEIIGPDDAVMSDGSSALGWKFDERLWIPRSSWVKKDPAGAARQKSKIASRLRAWFGSDDAIPDGELTNAVFKDLVERVCVAQITANKGNAYSQGEPFTEIAMLEAYTGEETA